MADSAVNSESVDSRLERELRVVGELADAVTDFAGHLHGADRDESLQGRLPDALRVTQYFRDIAERSVHLARRAQDLEDTDAVSAELDTLRSSAMQALEVTGRTAESAAIDATLDDLQRSFEQDYQEAKARFLRAGASRQLATRRMVALLEYASTLHRIVNQTIKARRYLAQLAPGTHDGTGEPARNS